MERKPDDVNVTNFTPDQINEMEERRIDRLNKAGIDEKDVLDKASSDDKSWGSYFNENITRGKDDKNFVLRDQWTAVERSEFSRLFKPCMTANKIYPETKKIIGEQRKNKPELMIRSLNGKSTQEQINMRADLVRSIAYRSQNDLVYQTAFESALYMGFGAFQICLDYESPRSFNKIIKYDIITDPTLCSWDPTAIKPHKGDGNYCSRSYTLSRDEFFATYPYVTNPVSYSDQYMLLDGQYQMKDLIIINDRFVKEWYPLIIYKLSNKLTVTEQEWKEAQETFHFQKEVTEGSIVQKIIEKGIPKIVNERQTQDYVIMHYRLLKDQIIDFSEWPSKQLPIPFVSGDSSYIEGRQYLKSYVHEARDMQKLFNYSRSELAAELKNRRREQWLATPDNIIGNEQQWRNPETQMGALIAKPDPKTGQMPVKMPAWEINQGLFASAQSANQDMREILGASEAEEMASRDISGKAKRERKIEASMSAYVFFDNLNQAIEQGGRIINDLLPYVIGDDERYMSITKRDGKSDYMLFNKQDENGNVSNRIEAGDFDVEINAGPSFAVQQETALEFFQQTIANNPQVFNLIADLWADNLDVQQREQVKERLKNLVPPDILAKEEGKKPPPPQPSPQEQMMQMEMQEKQAKIQNEMKKLELDEQELQIKKANLMLQAQKAQNDAQVNVYDHQLNLKTAEVRHHLDNRKLDTDFTHKMSKILADMHTKESKKAS